MIDEFLHVAKAAVMSADSLREAAPTLSKERMEVKLSLLLQSVNEKLVEAAAMQQEELVFEIPTGSGATTVKLAAEALRTLGYKAEENYPISYSLRISWKKEKTNEGETNEQ